MTRIRPRRALKSLAHALTSVPAIRALLLAAVRAGVVPRRIWFRLPISGQFHVAGFDDRRIVYESTAGDVVGRTLFWAGIDGWEPETVPIFWKLAQRSTNFYDIGANTGLFSLLALSANPEIRVAAFEPVPALHQRLQRNVELNGWMDRTTLRQSAVSEAPGTAEFHVPSVEVPCSSSLDPAGYRGLAGNVLRVEVTTVDRESETLGTPDLIKIDVEGFEDRVLLGMSSTLANQAPTIILECNEGGPSERLTSLLRQHGYSFFHIRDVLTPVEAITPDPTRAHKNFLCTTNADGMR